MKTFLSLSLAAMALFSGQRSAAVYPSAPPVSDSVYVCMSGSAYAYHSGYCSGLKRCTHEVRKLKKKDALDRGFSKACSFCYP